MLEKFIDVYLSGDYFSALFIGAIAIFIYLKKLINFAESIKWSHLRRCKEALDSKLLEENLERNLKREYNVAAFSKAYGLHAYSIEQMHAYLYVMENIKVDSGRIMVSRAGYAIAYKNGRMSVSYGWREKGMMWLAYFAIIFMGLIAITTFVVFIRSIQVGPNWLMLYYGVTSLIMFILYLCIAVIVSAVRKLSREVKRIYQAVDTNINCVDDHVLSLDEGMKSTPD